MRNFIWNDINENHAILFGPEPERGDVAAVIVMDYGSQELMDSRYIVASSLYKKLNFEEEDTSLPIEQIKRRVIILLGNELSDRREEIEADLSNVLEILMEGQQWT